MGLRTFQPNDAGLQALLLGPEVAGIVEAEAERAKVIAQGLAADFEDSGEYERSFVVTTEVRHLPAAGGSAAHDVVAGILTNTAEYADVVEVGSEVVHTAHHTLARTLDSLGSG